MPITFLSDVAGLDFDLFKLLCCVLGIRGPPDKEVPVIFASDISGLDFDQLNLLCCILDISGYLRTTGIV